MIADAALTAHLDEIDFSLCSAKVHKVVACTVEIDSRDAWWVKVSWVGREMLFEIGVVSLLMLSLCRCHHRGAWSDEALHLRPSLLLNQAFQVLKLSMLVENFALVLVSPCLLSYRSIIEVRIYLSVVVSSVLSAADLDVHLRALRLLKCRLRLVTAEIGRVIGVDPLI